MKYHHTISFQSSVYYVAITTKLIFSGVKTTSCSRANVHLVFHWCLYDTKDYLLPISVDGAVTSVITQQKSPTHNVIVKIN